LSKEKMGLSKDEKKMDEEIRNSKTREKAMALRTIA